ncbi:CCA tRNA nucleotidyltransferase [Glycomyces sp. TRM65418]|uniref:CCA tRNA nucleotidyltransferase n=1 Tax=Glycomyces sp. TRM65418 TaxID=2867006 RepID=UPI001CE6A535|nr:CCA tRNA nucleotidyltransferase [Glycomyces sp. TRM65418]MCC3764116.1 CCA tRNA nucleotidyltransferase [Glycomyces sp. TRM65418]QZD53804.1 CCA tRNA nucleotidyltransferase [Glycomyces sp. TRM65418]
MSDNSSGKEITVPPIADELGRVFAGEGHELHLVGGPVRDAVLRRKVSDLDFATDARPEATEAILRAHCSTVWTTGADFGTVGGMFRGEQVEVTTFRADAYDRVSRNPIVRYGDRLEDDLERRDFTVNAMAVSVPGHVFSDPFGGLADLARQTIRTPAAPESSFADDPLRMLRAARFAAQLGFGIDPDTLDAVVRMAPELSRITAERIRDEFNKLLLAPDPVVGLRVLVDTGLAERFLPELPALRMEIDEHAQHKDVYEHSLQVLRNAIELETDGPDLLLRLAALLHDIGKPETKDVVAGGGVTFHHHDVAGARLARRRMRELKYPKADVQAVSLLISLHLRFYGYGDAGWTDSAVRRYVTDAGNQLERLHRLVRSDCTTRNRRKAERLRRDYDAFEDRIARIRAEEDLRAVRPDLDGNAIMALLGLRPGPEVGRAWAHLKELRLERGPMPREEAERELRSWAAKEGIAPRPDAG